MRFIFRSRPRLSTSPTRFTRKCRRNPTLVVSIRLDPLVRFAPELSSEEYVA